MSSLAWFLLQSCGTDCAEDNRMVIVVEVVSVNGEVAGDLAVTATTNSETQNLSPCGTAYCLPSDMAKPGVYMVRASRGADQEATASITVGECAQTQHVVLTLQ